MSITLISGSAREDGDTETVASMICATYGWRHEKLADYRIDHYNYCQHYEDDDFLPLVKSLIELNDVLIYFTPVYWYAMSGYMKVYYDRLTDLLTAHKPLGRQLRTKKTATISISNGNHLGEAFFMPFKHSADYLGMEYLGDIHLINDTAYDLELKDFCNKIMKQVT